MTRIHAARLNVALLHLPGSGKADVRPIVPIVKHEPFLHQLSLALQEATLLHHLLHLGIDRNAICGHTGLWLSLGVVDNEQSLIGNGALRCRVSRNYAVAMSLVGGDLLETRAISAAPDEDFNRL